MLFNIEWPSFIQGEKVDGINFLYLQSIPFLIQEDPFDTGESLAEFNDKLLQRSSLEVIGGTQKIFQVPKFMCAL